MVFGDINIKRIDNVDDLAEAFRYIEGKHLWYPQHDAWARKAFVETVQGIKTVVAAYSDVSSRYLAGRAIDPNFLQNIKNLLGSDANLDKLVETAIEKERVLVGVVVYQTHKEDDRLLELKHLSVTDDSIRRGIAHCLLKAAEDDAKPHHEAVYGDCNTGNFSAVGFLSRQGYDIIGKKDVYDAKTDDYMFLKTAKRFNLPKFEVLR